MPIFCEPLAAETLRALNQAVNDLPAEHHLRKDSDAGIVSIVYDQAKDVTIFHGQSGFYFRRGPVVDACLLYTSQSPRDRTRSRMPSSA